MGSRFYAVTAGLALVSKSVLETAEQFMLLIGIVIVAMAISATEEKFLIGLGGPWQKRSGDEE